MALTGTNAFLSPRNWEDSTVQDDGFVIDCLIEVDAQHREVVLTATCECGHAFGESGFDYPDAAFEAAAELVCPHHPHDDAD